MFHCEHKDVRGANWNTVLQKLFMMISFTVPQLSMTAVLRFYCLCFYTLSSLHSTVAFRWCSVPLDYDVDLVRTSRLEYGMFAKMSRTLYGVWSQVS